MQQAFSSDVALLRIARRLDTIVLQVDWRRYNERFHPTRRPSQQHVPKSVVFDTGYTASLKRHNFLDLCFPRQCRDIVRKGGITNHHLIAYSPGNICAKNYQNRLMWIGILKPANLHHPWVACSDSSSSRKAIERHSLCNYHVRHIFVGDSAKIAHRDVESAFNSLTVGVVEQILQNISRSP